jgi:hypothetical protein
MRARYGRASVGVALMTVHLHRQVRSIQARRSEAHLGSGLVEHLGDTADGPFDRRFGVREFSLRGATRSVTVELDRELQGQRSADGDRIRWNRFGISKNQMAS